MSGFARRLQRREYDASGGAPSGLFDQTLCGFTYAPGYPGGVNDFAGGSLINGAGITIQSNQTYYYYKNLGQGAIGSPSTPVHNVTFIGCVWEASGASESAIVLACDGPATFQYCTIRPIGHTNRLADVAQTAGYQYGIIADGTPASPGTWNSFCKALTVDHCDIWGYANAVMAQYSTQTTPHQFLYTWVHNSRLNTSGSDHTDGIGLPAGGVNSYITVDHCWVEDDGDTQGLAYQNSPGPSTYDHFTITNNVFGGFGFTVCLVAGTSGSPVAPSYITFTDNVFSTKIKPIYGPLYSSLIVAGTGSTWRRNTWQVPSGAAWGNPAHNGWYWLPIDSNIIGTDDTPFVSQTDYTG